ncbi:E3 ubiquitin-protein ligase rnf213-beta-like [Saccostrea cucullata]|uniref:E3 ubiquitin-protein ligase rnf213-beta-like n=1 Tax=Saccostrea cuccullata TaxID=36930 RepID=UPI002ED6C12A
MKDLKSYSDLALMSLHAESEDRSMRVTNLHTVTMAYSPLIFNYMNIKGEKELIRKCSEVWESQEKDPDLPKKLSIAHQFLNWFKTLKETHGHVELNSLKQVDLIIEKGVFFVGKTNFLFRANEKYFHNLLRTGDENIIGFKVTDTIKELSTSLSKCRRVVILDDPHLASRVRGKIGRENCCVTSASTEKLHSADLKYSYNGNCKGINSYDI